MEPAKGTTRLRPDLSVVAGEKMIEAANQGFIAAQIAPYVSVGSQAADYPVLPTRDAFNVEDVRRASGAAYKRSGGTFEAGFYSCRERGHEFPVDDRFRAMYGSVFDMEKAATEICTGIVLRAFEVEVAAKLTKVSNFQTGAAVAKWTDHANADPKKDTDNAIKAARAKGVILDSLVLSWNNFTDLTHVQKVVDAVRYLFPDTAKTGTIQLQHLEAYLDIKILLAGALKNGANKAAKNPDLTDIWPDNVATFACVAPQEADISYPSIARTFKWNEGSSEDYIVEDYREDTVRGQIIRVRHDIDVALIKSFDEDRNVLSDISKNCGYILTGIR